MTIQQDDVLEIAARSEYDAVEDVVNVYQFQLTSASPVTDAQGIDDLLDIMEQLYTIINAIITTVQLYRDIRISNKTQSTLLGLHPWPSLTAGAGTGNPEPPGVCGVVNFSTSVARVTPRKYIGGLPATEISSVGLIQAGAIADLADFALLLLNPITVGGRTYVFGYESPKTMEFEIPLAATVSNVPGYQRRRKQGRGS